MIFNYKRERVNTCHFTFYVKSNEVANSGAMELEGLKRCLAVLENQEVQISQITTDRHPQVQKFLRIYCPVYDHRYDCWHVAKGEFLLQFQILNL